MIADKKNKHILRETVPRNGNKPTKKTKHARTHTFQRRSKRKLIKQKQLIKKKSGFGTPPGGSAISDSVTRILSPSLSRPDTSTPPLSSGNLERMSDWAEQMSEAPGPESHTQQALVIMAMVPPGRPVTTLQAKREGS